MKRSKELHDVHGENTFNAGNLSIDYVYDNGVLEARFYGSIDRKAAQELSDRFDVFFEMHQIDKVKIDLLKLESISCDGVKSLIKISEKIGKGKFICSRANRSVHELFAKHGIRQVCEAI